MFLGSAYRRYGMVRLSIGAGRCDMENVVIQALVGWFFVWALPLPGWCRRPRRMLGEARHVTD